MQKPVTGRIPRGVGAPPPPGMDSRSGHGKLMCIKVRMLDDSIAVFHLGHKANGQALFDKVCRHLNLLECDYFGLEFLDRYGNRCWLEKDKSILRQITAAQSDARFYFICKFYTPNPTELEEDYTRYLLGLQIRRDLTHGELLCNENTAALLASFIVQAECGDFSADDYPDHTYLSATNFVPNQTPAFQQKVMENHKKLIGMGPDEADLALLEAARRCDFYGIKLHAAKDIEGTDVALSVAHMGIKVFHQLNCISTFSWAKIRKLSFKRKRLMIKLHPESYQYYKEMIEFNFDNRNECKNFWKKCVEHHAFFRCLEASSFDFGVVSSAALTGMPPTKKDTRRLFSHGSSFRYQGRTQKQLIDYVREHRKRREPFQRPLRSNRITNDPYGLLRGAMAPRKIQFNVIDPMLASTNLSAGVNHSLGQFSTAGETSAGRCSAPSNPYQQPLIGPFGGNSAELQQRYPDVYYPSGIRPPQQQISNQQQQYYHYYHCGNQQYPNKSLSTHDDYYHQPYDLRQQQQQYLQYIQQPSMGYGMPNDSQRPKSVYATMSAAGDKTAQSQYGITSAVLSKNHRSSNDIAGISDRIAPRPLQQTQRAGMKREESLPEADENVVAGFSNTQHIPMTKNNNGSHHHRISPPAEVQPPGDQMSTSLPNVLTEDLKVMSQQYRNVAAERSGCDEFFTQAPPKSMSGESFLDDLQQRPHHRQHRAYCHTRQQRDALSEFIDDNMSEGSYRIGNGADGTGGGNSSSTSDVGVESLSARALSATFTTKRVGNVIVKRVIDSSISMKHKEQKGVEDFEEDESHSESYCKMSSVSAPTSSRSHVEQRPIRQRVPLPSTATDVYECYHPSPAQLPGDEEIYLKNYVIEQDPSGRGDNISRGILKNVANANAQPSTSAELRPTISRPIIVDHKNSQLDDKSGVYDTTGILTRSRPVIVTPISVRNPASIAATRSTGGGSASSSTFSTPQPTVKHEHQISITMPPGTSSNANGKPIVQGTKFTRLADEKSPKTDEKKSNEIETAASNVPRGIPGRVISKQNMVITPSGILPKEEIIGVQRGEKPKVPPKPKGITKESVVSLADTPVSTPSEMNDSEANVPSTLPTLQMLEPSISAGLGLVQPDGNSGTNVERAKITTSTASEQHDKKLYDQIHVTVQSEDEPDVYRLQTFCADTQIPYTLTMRNVGTPKFADKTINGVPFFGKGRRQQILDLIERKQLPSQNSFSSQDHSISPTSPESGNVTEYIRRRRSMSSDRCPAPDADSHSTATTAAAHKERRRQTQQVEAPIKYQNGEPAANPTKNTAPKASLDEDLPEPPPPSVFQPTQKDEKSPQTAQVEAHRLAQKIVSGILETDF